MIQDLIVRVATILVVMYGLYMLICYAERMGV